MPCQKCGSIVIRFGVSNICPYCNSVPLLNRRKAILELYANDQAIESAFSIILKNYLDKYKLLIKLCWQRESFSRSFFQKYQAFDTNEFLSSNLLILRTMKEARFKGKKTINDAEIEIIVSAFKRIIESKESRLLLMHGLAEAFQLYDKIRVLYNEHYFSILSTYEDNDIMEQSKAKEKIKEYLPSLLSIISEKKQTRSSKSPEEFVKKFYAVINQFYCCFMRNEIYDEVFGLLRKYKEININPQKLMTLVNSYPMNEGSLYHTSLSEFIARAKKFLEIDVRKIRELLIFSESNTQTFPIFLAVNGRVYISHRTTFLIFILLHAIIYKDLFDEETEKRSKEFEKEEVKNTFEGIGWAYYPNKTDKKNASLEIDGIATFKRKMVVIECKGWKLRPFYEYKQRQDQLLRDIKGIVDGVKYTELKPRKIPSILEKTDFVKANMDIWGFDRKDFDEIEGLIILRGFPPISKYKSVHVLSVKDIEKRFDSRNTV